MQIKKGLLIASATASLIASSALACDGDNAKKQDKKITDDSIQLGDKDGCKGKDGCHGKKKIALSDDAIQLGDKDGCKGKDGCSGKKK